MNKQYIPNIANPEVVIQIPLLLTLRQKLLFQNLKFLILCKQQLFLKSKLCLYTYAHMYVYYPTWPPSRVRTIGNLTLTDFLENIWILKSSQIQEHTPMQSSIPVPLCLANAYKSALYRGSSYQMRDQIFLINTNKR